MGLEYTEIIVRMLVAILAGGIVGYERDATGHDAGARTHMLVCLGAAIATIVQVEASEWVIQLAQENPDLTGVLSTDITRITAQIITGIGFLGAGTIIVTKRSVSGLTTAASIWAIASIGIAVGMGFYFTVGLGTLLTLIVLGIFKRALRLSKNKTIKITYENREHTLDNIYQFFEDKNIKVTHTEYSINMEDPNRSISEDIFTLIVPRSTDLKDVIPELANIPYLISITAIKEELN